MVSLELFHLSMATKYNKKWGQEMKNRKVLHFFPFSLVFAYVATL